MLGINIRAEYDPRESLMKNILVLGVGGMLGSTMMRALTAREEWDVFGTLRSSHSKQFFPSNIKKNIISNIDVQDFDVLSEVLIKTRPKIVINCVGMIKQIQAANDPLQVLPINALLPHRLANLCKLLGSRLVHISTDCVFSGEKGDYLESDISDANDLYGKSKFIGEISSDSHAITLRTSIIGHELQSANGLLEWFLSQDVKCKGYNRAIFSGLPTITLAKIINDIVIPRPELHGLYHVSSAPISKFNLLKLIAKEYSKTCEIIPDDSLVINRSLNSNRFSSATGFKVPDWKELVHEMHMFHKETL